MKKLGSQIIDFKRMIRQYEFFIEDLNDLKEIEIMKYELNDIYELTIKNNNFDKILKSKKVLIGSIIAGLVLLVAFFSLI